MALEGAYKTGLIKRLERRFPGCLVVRLDSAFLQGVPDLLMLWGPLWASFEAKKDPRAAIQPNQPYYVDLMNKMSFSAFIYPENEEAVLNDLEQVFQALWPARIS